MNGVLLRHAGLYTLTPILSNTPSIRWVVSCPIRSSLGEALLNTKTAVSYLFQKFTSDHIVYNALWEDPRIDRSILNLGSDSRVLTITSAGCNALEYLLDDPHHVDCVDLNPCQNALLNLKKAAFSSLPFKDVRKLFFEGRHPEFRQMLDNGLGEHLADRDRQYWSKNHRLIDGGSARPSFYYHGTTGALAWMCSIVRSIIPNSRATIERLFDSETLEIQRQRYLRVRWLFSNVAVRVFMRTPLAHYLVGVPKAQVQIIRDQFRMGLGDFWLRSVDHVFMNLPLRDNYFWRVYALGSYSEQARPEYLAEENFAVLASRVDRIRTHTTSIIDHLESTDVTYTHMVLLDHMDWMYHDPDALSAEWESILKRTDRGSIVLIRSAGSERWFVPDEIVPHFDFVSHEARTNELHRTDRVGTYGSTHLGVRVTRRVE